MERGGDLLVFRRLRQKVSGELLQREHVEGLVRIEGANHIVAIRPDGSGRIVGIPAGIGIAGQIEPQASPMFAIGSRCEKSVNESIVVAGLDCSLRTRGRR